VYRTELRLELKLQLELSENRNLKINSKAEPRQSASRNESCRAWEEQLPKTTHGRARLREIRRRSRWRPERGGDKGVGRNI
jgi:hypothetical protein